LYKNHITGLCGCAASDVLSGRPDRSVSLRATGGHAQKLHRPFALTKQQLQQDPLTGHLFVFINRRGDYLKALYWDRTGFCLWAKRLERGRFVSN